jgi:intracellular septation protein
MRTLLDFLPILLFFSAYKLHHWFDVGQDEAIYFATPVLMVATSVQMAILYAYDRKLSTLHKVTLGMVLVFGSITLVLHNKQFIMWKPTVMYLAIALAMAVALWGMQKNFFKSMLGSQLDLPERVWHNLGVAWIGFALFLAGINAYVVSFYTEEDWINFKIWGYGFWLIFFVGQVFYIAPHLKTDENQEPGAGT